MKKSPKAAGSGEIRETGFAEALSERYLSYALSTIASMVATMRNSRLLAEAMAPSPTTTMAKVNSNPPRVIR